MEEKNITIQPGEAEEFIGCSRSMVKRATLHFANEDEFIFDVIEDPVAFVKCCRSLFERAVIEPSSDDPKYSMANALIDWGYDLFDGLETAIRQGCFVEAIQAAALATRRTTA
ncbi:MAG: hypothetical protein ACOX9E_02105 [Lentisphaeria bacterium]